MSPTADQSDVRSTRSSSSSKVLAAKFDSLCQEWEDHETDSPIKTVTIGGKRDSRRKSSPKETTSTNDERDNRKSSTKDKSLHTPASHDRDDDSVGSISTLGSTESVFERLYSQRKPSSTKKSHREYESRIPNSSGGSVGSAGKYRTPMSARMRQSGGTKNRKNRLGAYSNSSALETKSVGYQDSTPRRRTTTRKASHRKDASSVVSALSAESEEDNSVFRRLYRNEKRPEKLWKVPDGGSVSSTPSRRRRTGIAKPSPVFERLHRNERRPETLWNDPDDGSVASTPVRRSRTAAAKPSPIFDRLHRNEKRSETLWNDPDDGSVASTPVRRSRTAITKPSPVFDRLYRNERKTALPISDDASVTSTVSRRSRTDEFDPNPTFVRMRNSKKRPDTRIKADDSSVCSTPSKSSRTEDSYYDPNSVFTTLYQKPPAIARTPPRPKPEMKPSPVFDRLYRSSPKRPVERARKKENVEASPQQTPARHLRREDSNPIYNRLHSNKKRTEKLWKIPKAFVPSPSNKGNSKPKEPPKSGDKKEQPSPFEDEQKYLQEIIEDKHNDDEQLQEPESPFEEEQKYLQEINKDEDQDEEDLQLLDKSPNEELLSGLKILTNDDLEVIDELERLENFYEGCTPTVALTSASSSNWDESPDARRQSNEGQPVTVPETNAVIVDKEVDTVESAISNSTQSIDDEQKSLDFKKKDTQTATKQKSGDDDTSRDTPTSTTYCVDSGDSYRSFSTGNNYIEEKTDRRRKREQIGSVSSPTSKSMLTPRSRRGACAVTIQNAYRLHRAELELVSVMIRSWDANIQFQNGNNEIPFPLIYRAPALRQALLGVRCWWILEGLRIEDDWTTLAWENEVCIGDNIRAQVNLSCEAKTVQSIFHWEPTKVATLLAKAILFKAIEREQASQNVAFIDDLCENATKLQRWFRGRRNDRHVEKEDERPTETIVFTLSEDEGKKENANLGLATSETGQDKEEEHPTETIVFTLSEDEGEEDDVDLGLATSETGHDSILSSWNNIEEEIVFDSLPTSASPNKVLLEQKNTAAIKIQSFFRLAILKSAIRDLPSTATRLESVLETTGPLSKRMDAVVAARNILLSSALDQQTDRNSEIISEEDFISQRAAALAINNIVQTYVTGLRKFREKKRATIIQTVFRGYRTRKRLELEELSAVVIQFAWSERRYIKIKEKSATKIQGLVRMHFRRRSYAMNRFCIVLMQSAFRRAIARRKLALLKSSALSLQSAWRASADRKRYLKFISAIESMQYLWKARQIITIYKKECQAATALQVWWRSQSPRKIFLESVKAATLLQSHIRSYLQCRKFRKAQFDSIMIQRSWRSYHWTKRYESQKRSAICLQAFYRRHQSIVTANVRRQSVLDIQRVSRGYLDRQKVSLLIEEGRKELSMREQNGAIAIQKIWRMSMGRKRYVILIHSTILLQRVIRGSIAHSLYKRKINAAQTIQSLFRRLTEESRRQKANLAAIQIQRNWRAALATKYEASVKLKKEIAATITIQSAWRCARARYKYNTMQNAAMAIQLFYRQRSAEKAMRFFIADRSIILIQSQWRGAVERENFTTARISAIMIQASTRRMLTLKRTKKLRLQNSLECHASTIIQSHWRGATERENFTTARISAIMIQASTRRMLTLKRTKKLSSQLALEQDASTVIQSHWRRAKANEEFEKARVSAIMIQASTRRMLTLKRTKKLSSQLALEQDASTVIQSHWRRAKANEEFEKARVSAMVITLGSKYNEGLRNELLSKSSIVIQACWRGAVAREDFNLARGAATIIQSCARRMFAIQKKQTRKAAKSSIKIQAYWRGLVAKKGFDKSREAAIMIQSRTRMISALRKLRKKESEKYMRKVMKSSIKIQAWWRAVMEQRTFTVTRGSAIMIQSYVRRWIALRLKEEAKHKILVTKSSVKIQACWRGVMAQETFIIARGSAIMIQASVRMTIARRMTETLRKTRLANTSSSRIQAYWRGSKARQSFDTARGAAILIQSCGRRTIAMKAKINLEHQRLATRSSTKIQAYWRGATVRGSVALAHDSAVIIPRDGQAINSIIAIQTFWRMAAARDRFTTVYKSTVRIQAVVRGMLARRSKPELNTEKMTSKSSIVIQSKWRELIARSKFHESRSAAIIIQAGLRRMSSSMQVQQLKKRVLCSVVIQSYWRRAIERERYAQIRFATIMIQSLVRRRMVRSKLTEMSHSLVLIQKSYRGHIARSEFDRARSAAICIQERFRSYRMKAISSAIVLQTSWKMKMARSAFLSLKTSTVLIQSATRGYIERERIKRKSASALLLQSYWRSSNAREHYVQCRGAIIIIQAMVRGKFARSQFKSNQRSAVCIQRNFRKILAQKRLQSAELLERDATSSSILIQSHWRGSVARDKYMQHRVAAMIIQSTIRGARVRSQWGFVRLLSTHKKLLNESARKIQLAYIAWKVDIELWELRSLAVLLQRGVRGQLARSAVQYALMQINASRHTAIVNSRARLVLEKVDGASSVCSWHKTMSGTRVSAAIIIQSFVRRFLIRNYIRTKLGLEFGRTNAAAIPNMQEKHSAAVKIQTIFRKWMASKHIRMIISNLKLKSEAATKIQKLHRRRTQEQLFALQKQAILTIQSAWRSRSARLALDKMNALRNLSIQTKAAVRIQALQRCRKQQEYFSYQKQAVLKLQCSWRKSMAKMVLGEMKALQDISTKTKAAIFLQAYQRRRKQERLYLLQKQAILKIQCSWRRKLAQLVYTDKQVSYDVTRTKAVTTIQTFHRCQQQKQRFLIQKQATVLIQEAWRGKLEHLAFVNLKAAQDVATETKAAVHIQAFQRCQKQKKHFLLQKQAILKIQCSWRRRLAKMTLVDVKKKHNIAMDTSAAISIQTFQRCHKQRHNYLLKKGYIITIQKMWRSFSVRHTFLTKKTAAILIQSKFRRYRRLKKLRSVIKIQSLHRKRVAQRALHKCKAAACRIQSKYRENQRKEALRQQRENQRRRMERDFKQALSEMRIASLLTAESLLSKKDTIKNSAFLKILAARVHSTLNEAALLVNEGTREMIRIDPFATDNSSSLKELEYRVQRAINEAASLSNEDIWQFISREPLVFPLPPKVEKFDLPTLIHTPTKDKGTPVRSNKGLMLSDSFEEIETLDFSPKATTSIKQSESKPLKSPGILKSSKHKNETAKASKNTMMSPLADLLREARAARSQTRTDSAPAAKLGKTPTKDTKAENATSPKNFGDAAMPSPIRPQEESADWDWAAEW